jgi:hypothetical protein
MSLPIKKLYIDSRHRTPDSVSTSNFKIQLPQPYTFPRNTVFFVTDVCIPHAWRNIEKNMNNKLYWAFMNPAPPGGFPPTWVYRCTAVTPGNYTPADYVSAINDAIHSIPQTQYITLTYNTNDNCITVTVSNSSLIKIKFFSNYDIPTY